VFEILNEEVIAKAVADGWSTISTKRLEGFACRVGELLSLMAEREREAAGRQAANVISLAIAKAGRKGGKP